VHYVLRLNCSYLGVYTTNSLQREGNYGHFLSKSTNGRVLRVVGMVSTLKRACSMFCPQHAVIRTFKRRTATNGKEITVIFCTNRRMVAFCELLDWFRRLIERALCSALKLQIFGRLYDELSPTGRKLRPFFVQIDEWSHFASCWTGCDA
jgi:hypothetical protein